MSRSKPHRKMLQEALQGGLSEALNKCLTKTCSLVPVLSVSLFPRPRLVRFDIPLFPLCLFRPLVLALSDSFLCSSLAAQPIVALIINTMYHNIRLCNWYSSATHHHLYNTLTYVSVYIRYTFYTTFIYYIFSLETILPKLLKN